MVIRTDLAEVHAKQRRLIAAMGAVRAPWFNHWRTLSDYYLPRRYPQLLTAREAKSVDRRNTKLLSSVSTMAVRTLASGMMNGITSPSRPWFRLRLSGVDNETMSHATKIWLSEVTDILYRIMSESNFYNSMAVLYLEWSCFGTASLIIYEDEKDVIRCHNIPMGEFYISQDDTGRVNRHARGFSLTVEQLVSQFGLDNVSEEVKRKHELGGENLTHSVTVLHLIEKNSSDDTILQASAPYRELYWEESADAGHYLSIKPFYDWPCLTPRWELLGNEPYGTSPSMDALGDVIELQHAKKLKGEGKEKEVHPPLIVDRQLANAPKALSARGMTYANTANSNFGAKKAYETRLPYQELTADELSLTADIRETHYNQLFNMISQLDTVRSATEINALLSERLVHLGPVLNRFENEGLDPTMTRVYAIADRRGMLPEPPEELSGVDIQVQYVGVLSDAQRAVSTASTERFMQFVAETSSVYPEVREIPDPEEIVRDYGESLGVRPANMRSRAEVEERLNSAKQKEELAETAAIGGELAQGAKALSETNVGGGANALEQLLGG